MAWDELLKLGLGDLGLSPDVFWSLTPVELMLLSGRSSHGAPVLDLDYAEDSNAETDANFVMTGNGGIVEIQGTAEADPFSEDEFAQLMGLAKSGISQLVDIQNASK